ncbi:MAG: TolC family protein [Acidobacteriota bacterium]
MSGSLNSIRKASSIISLSVLIASIAVDGFSQIVAAAQQSVEQPQAEKSIDVQRVGIDESRPLALTLFDAIKMALSNNREIEVERLNVSQAQYDLVSARGSRDIQLGGSSFFENRTVPVGSILGGGPNGALTTRTYSYDLNAQQLLSTGAQWTAQMTNSRVNSNNVFSSLNPQFNTSINFQIRQPIVRNFSIDDARRRIRIAARRLDLSDSQFRLKTIDIISRVERAYWDLVYALRDLQIRRESVELARTQIEQNKRKVQEGILAPMEIVSVEVELERRKESVLAAIDSITRAENALKQLILGDRRSDEWARPILPTDTPDESAAVYTLDGAVRAALVNRPEIAQNDLQKEINQSDVKYFENQTRPQIDLVASYTTTGLSGSPSLTGNPFGSTTALLTERVNVLSARAGLPPLDTGSNPQLPEFLRGGYGQSLENLFSNDFRTLRFGVSFSFPLKNRVAEGNLGRAVAEGRKITAQRQSLEQSIEVEVRNALQTVETARRRVETARASREAAEKQSQSEQRRFEAGLSTTFLVLERQNALSEARGRELRALTDYNKALSELNRVMGTTLTSANVEIRSPQSSR